MRSRARDALLPILLVGVALTVVPPLRLETPHGRLASETRHLARRGEGCGLASSATSSLAGEHRPDSSTWHEHYSIQRIRGGSYFPGSNAPPWEDEAVQSVLQSYLEEDHVVEIDEKGKWVEHKYDNYTWVQKAADKEMVVIIYVPLHYSMKRSDLNVSIEYDHVEVTAFKNQTLLEGFLFDKIDKEDGASFWEIEYFNYRRCIKISLVKRERYTWNYCFKKFPEYVNDTNINLRHHKQINFATAADWAERQKNT
mmetsp:Transcript_3709/g.8829  ORF Transcript_3709/g.8829 Transcript_3709/m.8829 type:complete len:255 (+) Transcript_3709:188-952(+)